jgi:hypothetical protein
MRTTVDLRITVTARDRTSLQRQLDEAVTVAMTRAMRDGCQGILVTQHNYDSYTVALSDDVPFGLTREHQDW